MRKTYLIVNILAPLTTYNKIFMDYFFKQREGIFPEQYKIELTEEHFTLLKWFSKNKEEILLQTAYKNITAIHLQAIEMNKEDSETAFIEFSCTIKTSNSEQDIVIFGDNSHSYTVFLNYLHEYCSEFSQINYTYEVNYSIAKIDKNTKINNYIGKIIFILGFIAIFMIYFNSYIAFSIGMIVLFLMLLGTILDKGTENVIEQGNYEAEQRPDCLLF